MKGITFLSFAFFFGISYSDAQESKPVDISLYYESMCGGCQWFIVNQYYPAFKTIGNIMNVHLVPYGNTIEEKQGDKWVYTCQHGKEECYGNLIMTCAIHFYPNVNVHFPFIHCIENASFIPHPRKYAPECAKKFELDYSKIESCANGDLGNKLEHEMALKTEALDPPHKYVPWITVEGVHTKHLETQAMNDLVGLICKTYKGSSKPPACQKYEVDPASKRCWKNPEDLEKNDIDLSV